jgi:hypothetical protein
MGKTMRKLFLLLTVSVFIPAWVYADTSQTISDQVKSIKKHYKKTTLKKSSPDKKKEESSPFKISGYIDASYNNLQRNYFTSGAFDRVFDNAQNGLTLQQTAITLAYQPSQGWGGLINPVMGYDTNIFAPYGFKPIAEFDSQTFSFDVPQAFLQYTANKLTISGGRFLELAGYEGLDPTQNTNFSRSILYGYAEPFTILGLRGTYVASDKLTLIAGINNGWDNIRDWSRDKTVELSSTYNMNSFFSFLGTIYSGQERVTPQTDIGPEGWRTLIDLIATFNITEKLSFIANYDYGWQTNATLPNGTNNKAIWQGIAGYLNYKLNDCWQTSLRGEYFNDEDGFRTGVRQVWKEVTLSLAYLPFKNFEIRAETRHDFSNVNSFTNHAGVNTNNNNQSYALEAFYKFG